MEENSNVALQVKPELPSETSENASRSSEFHIPACLLKSSKDIYNSEYLSFSPYSHDEFLESINLEGEYPFSPVVKHERLIGKIIDFTATSSSISGKGPQGRRKSITEGIDDGLSPMGANPELEEWSIMMDQSKAPSTRGFSGRRVQPRGSQRGHFRGASTYQRRRHGFASRALREPSVHISPEWILLEEIEFSRLSKLSFQPNDNDNPVVLETNENEVLRPSNRSMVHNLSAKNEKSLGPLDVVPNLPLRVISDQKLLDLAAQSGASVATTDIALSALMGCSRSVLPWDLQVFNLQGLLIVDLRPGWTPLDSPSVNENSEEPPIADKDHINGAVNLSAELARINAKLPSFISGSSESTPLGAFRYCLWDLGDGLRIMVRCEVNFRNDSGVGLICPLLEYEPGRTADWRSSLDTQRAAVVATEAKNNAAVLSRWLFSAILAHASIFKLAFVSRLSPRERTRHSLLGIHEAEPYDASIQLGIDVFNGFGILKALLRQLLNYGPEKNIVLLKDPNKPLLRLYAVPTKTATQL